MQQTNEITYEHLRSLGNNPRVHPNGFIQLDISETTRLHVWPTTPLPKRKPSLPIHDHIYTFESVVLYGELVHTTYEFEVDPEGEYIFYAFQPYQIVRKSLPPIREDQNRYRMVNQKSTTIRAGEKYSFEPFLFHSSTWSILAASIFTMSNLHRDAKPRVVSTHKALPPISYERDKVDPEILWAEIKKVFDILQNTKPI